MNYSPFDVVFHFAKFVPVRIILMMMQEMLRLNRIYDGINFATKNFSGALLFVCIFGTLKGQTLICFSLVASTFYPVMINFRFGITAHQNVSTTLMWKMASWIIGII